MTIDKDQAVALQEAIEAESAWVNQQYQDGQMTQECAYIRQNVLMTLARLIDALREKS